MRLYFWILIFYGLCLCALVPDAAAQTAETAPVKPVIAPAAKFFPLPKQQHFVLLHQRTTVEAPEIPAARAKSLPMMKVAAATDIAPKAPTSSTMTEEQAEQILALFAE